MESWKELMNTLVTTVFIPIILIAGSTLLVLIKSYADKITKSILEKNKIEELESMSSTKNQVLDGIDKIVEAAVCANMQLAEELKDQSKEHKLTSAQANQLHDAAKQLIYNSLPKSLKDENNALLKLIGGKQVVDTLIENMMEKHIIEWKDDSETDE
jgi:3-phosphoglycerate kinase